MSAASWADLGDAEGGFCLRSNSNQGTFEGWTVGYWFIARETE